MLPFLLGLSFFAPPANSHLEVVALDNDQVRIVRVKSDSPNVPKTAALYVYFDGPDASHPPLISWRQATDRGPHLRIELKHIREPEGSGEIQPSTPKAGAATDFESRDMRVQSFVLDARIKEQNVAAGAPALLIALAPVTVQLHSKPRSFTTTLGCGDFYWMHPYDSVVLKRIAACDARVLRIGFPS